MIGNLYTWAEVAKALEVNINDFIEGCDIW
jgi:hypothetical protein